MSMNGYKVISFFALGIEKGVLERLQLALLETLSLHLCNKQPLNSDKPLLASLGQY